MVVVGIVAAAGGGRKLLGDATFSGTLGRRDEDYSND
jgi:hypothetical protein